MDHEGGAGILAYSTAAQNGHKRSDNGSTNRCGHRGMGRALPRAWDAVASFLIHVQRQRKSRANQCRRRGLEIVSRLLDVGHHLARVAGCAGWFKAVAAPHSLRDARPIALPESAASQVRENLRRYER